MTRKKIYIIIANVLVAAILAVYLVISSVRSGQEWDNTICNNLEVVIVDSAQNQFVKKEDVAAIFKGAGLTYFGKRFDQISIVELEKLLESKSLIKNADLYLTADGALHVKLTQRKPVVRVFASNGQSFYIDNEGFILQPYRAYTSHVPVVSGYIQSPFSANYRGYMEDHFKKTGKRDVFMEQLYQFAVYLAEDERWAAQVEQIYVNKNQQVELVPRVGAHVIMMGGVDNYEYKLAKLATLYRKGLPPEAWNQYDRIDLSYSNQVICKKKK